MTIDANTVVILIAAAFGGTGILGGYAALRRAPADTGKVIAEAAQGAVIVQQAAIKQLEKELLATQARLDEAQQDLLAAVQRAETLQAQIDAATTRADSLQRQVDELSKKVACLEASDRA